MNTPRWPDILACAAIEESHTVRWLCKQHGLPSWADALDAVIDGAPVPAGSALERRILSFAVSYVAGSDLVRLGVTRAAVDRAVTGVQPGDALLADVGAVARRTLARLNARAA